MPSHVGRILGPMLGASGIIAEAIAGLTRHLTGIMHDGLRFVANRIHEITGLWLSVAGSITEPVGAFLGRSGGLIGIAFGPIGAGIYGSFHTILDVSHVISSNWGKTSSQ